MRYGYKLISLLWGGHVDNDIHSYQNYVHLSWLYRLHHNLLQLSGILFIVNYMAVLATHQR